MKHETVCIIVFMVSFLPSAVIAQSAPATPPSLAVLSIKLGIINVQTAISSTIDGQKQFQALQKKFEPKANELKVLASEIDGLKKQLDAQGPKMNDAARASLLAQLDTKQKTFGREQEDSQGDFTQEQNEIAQKILQKLLPVIEKYTKENGLSLLIDISKPWPDSPLMWASPSMDITKAVVDIHNTQLTTSGPPSKSK